MVMPIHPIHPSFSIFESSSMQQIDHNYNQKTLPDHIYMGLNDEELNDLSTHSLNQLLSASTYVNQPSVSLDPLTLPESNNPRYFPTNTKPTYLQQQHVPPSTSLVPLSYDHGCHQVDYSELAGNISDDLDMQLNQENHLQDHSFSSRHQVDSFAEHEDKPVASGYTIHNPTALLFPDNYQNCTPTCQPTGPLSPPTNYPSATYPLSSSMKSTFKSNIDLSSLYNNKNIIKNGHESSPLFHRSRSIGASKQEHCVQQPTVSDLGSVTSDNGFDFDQFDPPEFTVQCRQPIVNEHLNEYDTNVESNPVINPFALTNNGPVSYTNESSDLGDIDLDLLLSPERPTYVNKYPHAELDFRNNLSVQNRPLGSEPEEFHSSRNNGFCDALGQTDANNSFDANELDEVMNGPTGTEPYCTTNDTPPLSPKPINQLNVNPVVSDITNAIDPNELFRQSTSNGPGDPGAYRWGTANKYITSGTLDLNQLHPPSAATINSHKDYVPRVYHTIQMQSLANDLKTQAQAHEKELARAQSESNEKFARLKDRIISLESDLDQANHQVNSVAELRRTFEDEKMLEIARVERLARTKYELSLKQIRDQVLGQQQQVCPGTASSADEVSKPAVVHASSQCDPSLPRAELTHSSTQTDDKWDSLQVLVDAAVGVERQKWRDALKSVIQAHSDSDMLAWDDPTDFVTQFESLISHRRENIKDQTHAFQQTDPEEIWNEANDGGPSQTKLNPLDSDLEPPIDHALVLAREEMQALEQKINQLELEHVRELEHIAMKWQVWQEALRDECIVVIGSSISDLREALANARSENEKLRAENGRVRSEVHAVKLRARSVVYKVREQYTNRLNAVQSQVNGVSQGRLKTGSKSIPRTLNLEHGPSNRSKQQTSHSNSSKSPLPQINFDTDDGAHPPT